MSILKDRIRPLDPASLQEFLAHDHEAEDEHVGTSSELASRGGYARTVTGTVAYLDEEADTYMLLRGNGDGELLRVPLRDITSARETATDGPLGSGRDAQVLGTGK